MTDIHVSQPITITTPPCETCGGLTRIYGIEPHPRLPYTDINTYVCDGCDSTQALVVPVRRIA